jgi:hypothetical protein
MSIPLTIPADCRAAYACGYAGGLIETSLHNLREIPTPADDMAAKRLKWAMADLEEALAALNAPFDVAREGGAA